MGLGKTATTLAHLLDRPGPHLVVCPLSVVHNWGRRRRASRPTLRVVVHHGADRRRGDGTRRARRADVVVTTYGLLPRDLDHLAAVEWSTVVLDEAQMIKNPATRAARAVRALRAGQKLALTGTPVENRLAELWAILDTVNPGMLGSREQFRHRYAKPIERDGDADAAGPAAAHHAAVRAAPHQGRPPARARPARQDRAGRVGRADPRAGRALPARRRSAARRRRARRRG